MKSKSFVEAQVMNKDFRSINGCSGNEGVSIKVFIASIDNSSCGIQLLKV